MGVRAVSTRPDQADTAQFAYLANEVDAWAAAAGAEVPRVRADLAGAEVRADHIEGQIRLAESAKQAIDSASAHALDRLGPAGDALCEQVLIEARSGAHAVLASACRRLAELYGSPAEAPQVEPPPDPSHPGVPEPPTHLRGPDLRRVYVVADAERYMDAVRSAVTDLHSRLHEAAARADDAGDRLYALGDAISVGATVGRPEPTAPGLVPGPAEGESLDPLASVRRDALEILDISRRSIAEMYERAETDLHGASGDPWAVQKQPA